MHRCTLTSEKSHYRPIVPRAPLFAAAPSNHRELGFLLHADRLWRTQSTTRLWVLPTQSRIWTSVFLACLHACMSVAPAVRRSCSQGQPAANRPRASTCRATSSFPGLLSILGCCFQPHARPGFGVNSQLASIGRQCHMFHGTSFCYGGSHPAAIYA